MAQKAKPGEKTLLELVSQGKIRTSEDFSPLSESEIVQKWVLPFMTGAEMETEDYDPGALDAAFASLGFVGGSLKTGYKLGKEAVKKIGSAYRRSFRPRVFPQKDELLRESAGGTAIEGNLERLRRQWGTVMPESEVDIGRAARAENISDRLRQQIDDMSQRLGGEPQAYQRGTYASQRNPLLDADDAIPSRAVESSIDIDIAVGDVINESSNMFGQRIRREQARAIVEDVGMEGWDQFASEFRTLSTAGERRAFMDNFMSKYKDAGVISGEKAIQHYKSANFKFGISKGDKQFRWADPRRGTEHSLKQVDLGSGSTMYELKIKRIKKPGDPKYSLSGNPAASLNFHVDKVVDDVYGEVHEIGHMSYFLQGKKRGEIYAGRLINDLLDRLPENTVINEASMTFDSFYLMFNQAVKKKASIVFDEGKRINIRPSSRSKWSKDIRNAQTVSERDKVIDDIFKSVRSKLKDYPKLEGRPKLTAQGSDIELNRIKIHNITAALAVALGLKNKEQLEKLLAHDPESVESQVFDNDFSI